VSELKYPPIVLSIAVGVLVAVQPGSASVKVRVDFDKEFQFRNARTVGWAPKAGAVMVGRSPDDDPEDIRRRAEPIIVDAVNAELPKRGLGPASGTPDLTVTYYLLLTIGDSSQTLGQFLPPVTKWAIPPFNPATTSLKVIQEGSLVLDLSSGNQPVWRGVGEAEIKLGLDEEKRAALIREAVQEILKRYPPRK
jgi:hypothetical protein